jgi:hypothetical protein
VPVGDRTRDQAHGRVELRTLKAVTVNHFGIPHAAQVLQVTRKTRDLGTRRWRTVVADALTSLPHAQASPARLADLIRGQWSIEICQAGCAYGMRPLRASAKRGWTRVLRPRAPASRSRSSSTSSGGASRIHRCGARVS